MDEVERIRNGEDKRVGGCKIRTFYLNSLIINVIYRTGLRAKLFL
jgi:hypothetical protein